MVGHRSRVTAFWCKTLTSTDLHAVDLSDPSIGTSCLLRPPTLIRPPEKKPCTMVVNCVVETDTAYRRCDSHGRRLGWREVFRRRWRKSNGYSSTLYLTLLYVFVSNDCRSLRVNEKVRLESKISLLVFGFLLKVISGFQKPLGFTNGFVTYY
ncbi:hypothetical protein Hanom_Chr01g00005501 [Helianthus anomalus]